MFLCLYEYFFHFWNFTIPLGWNRQIGAIKHFMMVKEVMVPEQTSKRPTSTSLKTSDVSGEMSCQSFGCGLHALWSVLLLSVRCEQSYLYLYHQGANTTRNRRSGTKNSPFIFNCPCRRTYASDASKVEPETRTLIIKNEQWLIWVCFVILPYTFFSWWTHPSWFKFDLNDMASSHSGVSVRAFVPACVSFCLPVYLKTISRFKLKKFFLIPWTLLFDLHGTWSINQARFCSPGVSLCLAQLRRKRKTELKVTFDFFSLF